MDVPVPVHLREPIPDEFRDGRSGVDAATQGTVRMASQAQLSYIKDLISKKNLASLTPEQRDWLHSQPETQWVEGTSTVSFTKARSMLDLLTKLGDRPKEERVGMTANHVARFQVGVPAGRYAVENNEGELRFYKVWVSRDKTQLRVYVEHGPEQSDLWMQNTAMAILQKIAAVGVREAAIRYGNEIGECSNCGRRLTNRISRELAIGPICGGRMFGDDFKVEVKQARARIIARGENPDEDVE